MVQKKGYILVEGHGEVNAAHNLVTRLSGELDLNLPWKAPRRWKNLHLWTSGSGGILGGIRFVRSKYDAGALLILKDEDDGCPKKLAPVMARQIRGQNLPFPTAYVLFRPEYEVLFLPCLEKMNFPPWDRDSWEARRGIKEWLSSKLPRGRSYKPTIDQLPMTRKIDLLQLRAANVPCFGTLERALGFLKVNMGSTGKVYPK